MIDGDTFKSARRRLSLICCALTGLGLMASGLAQSRIVFTNSGQSLAQRGVATDAALGDMDGDGDLDIVEANSGDAENGSQLWINQGGAQGGVAGAFVDSGQRIATGFRQEVALSNLDDSCDLDSVIV